MKLMFLLVSVISAVALADNPDLLLYNALRHGAEVKIILRVVDQDGIPVANANISGGFQTGGNINDNTPIKGVTDTNGEYVVLGRCTSMVRCGISKEGYYESDLFVKFPERGVEQPIKNGKWIPYGIVKNVILKKILSPNECRIFPSSLRSCRIPEFGKWIGFDFEKCDWVSPCGEGVCADVLLKFECMRRAHYDYKYVMNVSFTNNPYAGAYILKADKTSQLNTVYNADSNATYQAEFVFVKEQRPGESRKWSFLDDNSYMVFRTRTRMDKKGNLTGAHYGKIMGRWFSGRERMVLSDGCFNLEENNVSIEASACLRDVLHQKQSLTSP